MPEPVQERDLRGTGWWLMEQLAVHQPLEARAVSVAASLLRVLAGLGPELASEDEALLEVELRGRLMHGQHPRDGAEWARASKVFDDAALAEFQRWELESLLLEGDVLDELDPLVGGQSAEDDVEVPIVERDEDGVRSHLGQ